MDKIIFHIDVNSAFLSWTSVERLKQGEALDLRVIPAIIGGDIKSRRGVVLAKSIPAKAYGIKTGEPVVYAQQKCPNLLIAAPDHKLYSQYSHELMSLLNTFSPNIEKVSIDECFMDVSSILSTKEHAVELAVTLKDCVCREFGYTVNVGISNKKILAKMASDFQKPNRVHTLFPDEISTKMWPLPVSELYMVGKSACTSLEKLEIKTIGDLARTDVAILVSHLKSHGRLIWEYANGIDSSIVQLQAMEAKNISSSTTLPTDISTSVEAKRILKLLSSQVASRLSKSGQLAKTTAIEIKYTSFQSVSHQMRLASASFDTDTIYHASCQLFDELWNGDAIRLLGVRTANLTKEPPVIQMNLFHDLPKAEKERKAEKAMEKLHSKYGTHILRKGL